MPKTCTAQQPNLAIPSERDPVPTLKTMEAESELELHVRSEIGSESWEHSRAKILFFYLITAIGLLTVVEVVVVIGPFSFELKLAAAFALFSSVRAFRKYLLQR